MEGAHAVIAQDVVPLRRIGLTAEAHADVEAGEAERAAALEGGRAQHAAEVAGERLQGALVGVAREAAVLIGPRERVRGRGEQDGGGESEMLHAPIMRYRADKPQQTRCSADGN
jgi:hypothetical protein